MKEYLAIYRVWKVKPFHHSFVSSGYTQDNLPTLSYHRFEAQNNSTAKKLAMKHRAEIYRFNSTFLRKIKIRLNNGKPIKHPELEELLEVTSVPIN